MANDNDNDDMNETEKESGGPRNPNEVRDLIYSSLSLTQFSKVPILFLGNPGIAKTTGVRMWAKQNNYEVTTLIGTQRVAEEILGYMVNDTGEKRLITYTPDWFDEIMENKKAGKKTLLFVDELSQAADNVQGAMLQLIFDRRVGGRNNFLPEDCLVVSAANYKGNIPPQCGIQAPTLNRFCIVNVMPRDGQGLVEEFLQSMDERESDLPEFTNKKITDDIRASARKELKLCLVKLFNAHARKSDRETALDFKNTEFSDVFDQPGKIYNFVTGRTVHYLNEMVLAMIHLGLLRKKYKPFIGEIALGLMGLGTNTFRSEKEKEDFQLSLISGIQRVLRRSVEEHVDELNMKELDYKGKNVSDCISLWMKHNEATGAINDINLQRLVENINNTYDTTCAGMTRLINEWKLKPQASKQILNDLTKIDTLIGYLKESTVSEIANTINKLSVISAAWRGYKAGISINLV